MRKLDYVCGHVAEVRLLEEGWKKIEMVGEMTALLSFSFFGRLLVKI